MTRNEAEEIFIAAVMSDETTAVHMTLKETQVFRVLIGRCLAEMEKKNRNLWIKARDFGIEYREPYAVIKKLDANRYKMYKVAEDGKLTPFVKPEAEAATSKNDTAEKGK